MTAMIGSADCPPARLAATRDRLHRVAEHILAAARYAASGEIGLVPSPGAPAQVYEPATPLDLDEPLMIDPGAARGGAAG